MKEISPGLKTLIGIGALAGAAILVFVGMAAFSGKMTISKKA